MSCQSFPSLVWSPSTGTRCFQRLGKWQHRGKRNGGEGKSIRPVGGLAQRCTSGESDCRLVGSETHKTSHRPSLVHTFKKHNLQNSKSPRHALLPAGSSGAPSFKAVIIFFLSLSLFLLSLHLVPSSSRPLASPALHLLNSSIPPSEQLGENPMCSSASLLFLPHPSLYPSSKVLPRLAFFFSTSPFLHLSLLRIIHSTFQPQWPHLPSGHLSPFR